MSLFTQIPYTLQTLIANIDSGILALPEIQRPFVWENAKVRDLLTPCTGDIRWAHCFSG